LNNGAPERVDLLGCKLTGTVINGIGQDVVPRPDSGTAAIGVSGEKFGSLTGAGGDLLPWEIV
jgi:hypothetical protein